MSSENESELAVCEAKILFRQLKPFPTIDESNGYKIDTRHFIEASNQIIDAMGCFGKLFSPVVKDMRQNVQKVADKFKQNETLFMYLEDLILKDANGKDVPFDTVTDGLLWLKRAFEMIEMFFRNMLADETCSEQVKPHLREAYETCLLPYHGFFSPESLSAASFVPSQPNVVTWHIGNQCGQFVGVEGVS
ncbi:AGAP001398-PA-like protein [Anopheles sinensis]|uniref:AGAP001398-PA-like protein n=1 Tax=Anopheles sinensis TaxID=74873 RepID=A0A084WQT3_ANOSI|nr:AGAP001398-PA-like protein [Anopheles sinensis]